jgi:hypothetical protein
MLVNSDSGRIRSACDILGRAPARLAGDILPPRGLLLTEQEPISHAS